MRVEAIDVLGDGVGVVIEVDEDGDAEHDYGLAPQRRVPKQVGRTAGFLDFIYLSLSLQKQLYFLF